MDFWPRKFNFFQLTSQITIVVVYDVAVIAQITIVSFVPIRAGRFLYLLQAVTDSSSTVNPSMLCRVIVLAVVFIDTLLPFCPFVGVVTGLSLDHGNNEILKIQTKEIRI